MALAEATWDGEVAPRLSVPADLLPDASALPFESRKPPPDPAADRGARLLRRCRGATTGMGISSCVPWQRLILRFRSSRIRGDPHPRAIEQHAERRRHSSGAPATAFRKSRARSIARWGSASTLLGWGAAPGAPYARPAGRRRSSLASGFARGWRGADGPLSP